MGGLGQVRKLARRKCGEYAVQGIFNKTYSLAAQDVNLHGRLRLKHWVTWPGLNSQRGSGWGRENRPGRSRIHESEEDEMSGS